MHEGVGSPGQSQPLLSLTERKTMPAIASVLHFLLESGERASEVAPWVGVLTAEPQHLDLILETRITEDKNSFPQVGL